MEHAKHRLQCSSAPRRSIGSMMQLCSSNKRNSSFVDDLGMPEALEAAHDKMRGVAHGDAPDWPCKKQLYRGVYTSFTPGIMDCTDRPIDAFPRSWSCDCFGSGWHRVRQTRPRRHLSHVLTAALGIKLQQPVAIWMIQSDTKYIFVSVGFAGSQLACRILLWNRVMQVLPRSG